MALARLHIDLAIHTYEHLIKCFPAPRCLNCTVPIDHTPEECPAFWDDLMSWFSNVQWQNPWGIWCLWYHLPYVLLFLYWHPQWYLVPFEYPATLCYMLSWAWCLLLMITYTPTSKTTKGGQYNVYDQSLDQVNVSILSHSKWHKDRKNRMLLLTLLLARQGTQIAPKNRLNIPSEHTTQC